METQQAGASVREAGVEVCVYLLQHLTHASVSQCAHLGNGGTHLRSARLIGGFQQMLDKSLRALSIQQDSFVLTVAASGPWHPGKVGEAGNLYLGPTPGPAAFVLGSGF